MRRTVQGTCQRVVLLQCVVPPLGSLLIPRTSATLPVLVGIALFTTIVCATFFALVALDHFIEGLAARARGHPVTALSFTVLLAVLDTLMLLLDGLIQATQKYPVVLQTCRAQAGATADLKLFRVLRAVADQLFEFLFLFTQAPLRLTHDAGRRLLTAFRHLNHRFHALGTSHANHPASLLIRPPRPCANRSRNPKYNLVVAQGMLAYAVGANT